MKGHSLQRSCCFELLDNKEGCEIETNPLGILLQEFDLTIRDKKESENMVTTIYPNVSLESRMGHWR